MRQNIVQGAAFMGHLKTDTNLGSFFRIHLPAAGDHEPGGIAAVKI